MKKTYLVLAAAAVAAILALTLTNSKPVRLGGGTVSGGANQSTTTSQAMVTGTTCQVLKNGPGVLSSVVISAATTTSFTLYDATTTVNGSIYGTTTLAQFGPSITAGTYGPYESAFRFGLCLGYPAGQVMGTSSTITWQ